MWTRRKYIFLFLAAVNLFGFLFFFLYSKKSFPGDWNEYFEGLSLFVRSAVVSYHRLPIHNPWRCGGSDLLINPQARVFSPFVLFDIFLSPQWACLSSLVLCGFAGVLSVFVLLEYLGCTQISALVGSVLFINSSWFALHFTMGHISYGDMQLLPLVFYLGLRFREKRFQLALIFLLLIFLMDGAVQTFIFSFYTLLCAWFTSRISKKNSSPPLDKKFIFKWSLIAFLLGAIKIIPAGLSARGRHPMFDITAMPFQFTLTALFDPLQSIHTPIPFFTPYVFHEFGCYLGWGATLLFLFLLFSRRGRTECGRYFFVFALLFWTATGWGKFFNPWAILQRIPILNQAHLQSRLFIILFLVFVILVAKSFDQMSERWKKNQTLWLLMATLCVGESFFVRFHITQELGQGAELALTSSNLMKSDQLHETVHVGGLTSDLLKLNQGALECGDRSFFPTRVLYKGHPDYRGEIYLVSGAGHAELERVLPAEFRIRYQTESDSQFAVNSNDLWGWKSDDPKIRMVSSGFGDLIQFKVPARAEGELTLQYSPVYLYPCLVLFLLGCVLFLKELWRFCERRFD